MSKIKTVIAGAKTLTVHFADGEKRATMGPTKLAEYLAEAGQWTFNVERTVDEGAATRVTDLQEELNASVEQTGERTFKFKVNKDGIKTMVAEKPPVNYIRLGRAATFTEAQSAAEYVRNTAKKEMPENKIAKLTATFEKGSVEGQVSSVFGDVLAYGPVGPVAAKLRDFVRITDADARYDELRAAYQSGAAVTDNFSPTAVFKYWFLLVTAAELPELPVESEAEEVDADEHEVEAA